MHGDWFIWMARETLWSLWCGQHCSCVHSSLLLQAALAARCGAFPTAAFEWLTPLPTSIQTLLNIGWWASVGTPKLLYTKVGG